MKKYKILADCAVWLHWFWIALLLGGLILQGIFDWYKPIHMIILIVTIASQIIFGGCPLVTLENALRRKYDPSQTYTGSFLCFWIKKVFKVDLSPIVITIILIMIIVASAIFYLRR